MDKTGKWLEGLAEREGFEPPLPVRVNLISSSYLTVTINKNSLQFPTVPVFRIPPVCSLLARESNGARTMGGTEKCDATTLLNR